jgi:hypothetical protein
VISASPRSLRRSASPKLGRKPRRFATCGLSGKDPRFWAAEMTYLERRHPDRWGRRQEEAAGPKVVVQIGIKDSDVQISLSPIPAASPTTESSQSQNES